MSLPGSFQVQGLTKRFAAHANPGSLFLNCLLGRQEKVTQSAVLDSISFDVTQGEAIGIVGENGAGKSTLLKLISGTIQPSAGKVRLHGRVFAILELGMGFNPEFTARENVAHVAGLMGISDVELKTVMPELEGFADIGDYFDQPMRLYSSGMYVRVAFALATAVRPDILIIDEALSVGDAHFQHKSFDRIRQFREQGTTLLFVSHDRSAVLSLCDRCLLLDKGRLVMDAEPYAVIDYYNALIAEKDDETLNQAVDEQGRTATSSGTGEAMISSVSLFCNDEEAEIIEVGSDVVLAVEAECKEAIESLVLGYMIKDRVGQVIYGINTHITDDIQDNLKPGDKRRFEFHFAANIGPGNYSVSLSLSSSQDHLENNYEWRDFALSFSVINTRQKHFAGCAWIEPEIDIRAV